MEGTVTGEIDWGDAADGDPLADLENGPLEVFWAFGKEAMAGFTARYRAFTGVVVKDLLWWDLRVAGRTRERQRWFVDRAIARSSAW